MQEPAGPAVQMDIPFRTGRLLSLRAGPAIESSRLPINEMDIGRDGSAFKGNRSLMTGITYPRFNQNKHPRAGQGRLRHYVESKKKPTLGMHSRYWTMHAISKIHVSFAKIKNQPPATPLFTKYKKKESIWARISIWRASLPSLIP